MKNRRDIAEYYLCDNAPNELEKYSAFLQFYEESTAPLTENGGHIVQIDGSILEDHGRFGEAVAKLRADPVQTREQFIQAVWPHSSGSHNEQRSAHRATAIIVQIGFMLNCNLRDKHSKGYRIGKWLPPQWEDEESFHDYVARAIPKHEIGAFDSRQQRKQLKAWKLVKRCNIGIDATDNVGEHLLYNPDTKRLRVFRHLNWLHAQLERLGDTENLALEDCLKLGALPRQLILETLDSFHRILFPLKEKKKSKSQDLLNKLIKDKIFDEETDRSESYSRYLPYDFEYHYWGDRMDTLAKVVRNPPPSNVIESWMDRHKDERYVLWIAILGLFLSALFGLLSCLIGAAQLYVAIIAVRQSSPN